MEQEFNILMNDHIVCPPSWGIQDECVFFHRMYYALGGEVYYSSGGRVTRLRSGHLYILPVMTPYTMWHNPEDPFEVTWLHVELREGVFPEMTDVEIDPSSPQGLILSALKLLCGKPENAGLVDGLFSALLTLLRRRLSGEKTKKRRMIKLEEWIDSHIGAELTVARLAEEAGLERSYFSREFREAFGMSPQRYITAKKMSAAARSLSHGESIARAGQLAGYADEKAFSRAFAAYMHMTPGVYRKSHIVQP